MQTALGPPERRARADAGACSCPTGPGVYTGEVVAGDPAGGQRLVTGDPVNTAARLEQAAPTDRDPHRRAHVSPGARFGRRRGRRATRAQGQGRAGCRRIGSSGSIGGRADTRRGRRGRSRRWSAGAAEMGRLREPSARPSEGRTPAHRDDRRRRRGGQVAADPRVPRVGGRGGLRRPRALPAVRPRHHVLAARRDRARGRRDRRRRPAGAGPGQAARPHRRRGGRRAAGLGHGPRATQAFPLAEVFWGVRRLVEILASRRPLVLVIDDIHSAESTLLDLIEHLSGADLHVPALILCHRPARAARGARRLG